MRSFVIRCQKMDLALATQLMADLPVQGPLVGFDRQEEVGPLLRGLLKNGCCVWRASAWISTPSSEGFDQLDQRLPWHHQFHFSEKLPFGHLLGCGEPIIREAELFASL